MAQTQQQLAAQMIAQLRRLDPSVSAEVGTPERKIIDTVAQALSDSQVDLQALSASLDIDSKFGDTLDRFAAIFGHQRQKATFATGYVTFSRTTASNVDIGIPINTTVQAVIDGVSIVFYTTGAGTLSAGDTESAAIPIRARVAGRSGNVAAGTITGTSDAPILGITGVNNEVATRGGIDREGDDEFKVRFKNTIFRNLAGTRDQYLALAVATQYSVKANVVGSQSVWREYIQVPPVDDATANDVDDTAPDEAGNGLAGEYTTALSILPYAKEIWETLPVFISSSQGSIDFFFRPGVDFIFNVPPKNSGDAFRLFTAYGDIGGARDPLDSPTRPNITFSKVYTGTDARVQAVRPGDVLLMEYRYLSDASRNNISQKITNAVDVYVDGGNHQLATAVVMAPDLTDQFVDDASSKFNIENYRRIGEPTKRPQPGNWFMPLFWQPVTALPVSITVSDNTYLLGVHYWAVEDVSELSGSIRARGGIEWSSTVRGDSGGTRRFIPDWTGVDFQPIEIADYKFDRNIVDLQAALEGSRQVTTDVLAHKAQQRFFKFDITIMYSSGANQNEVNLSIQQAVDTYFKSQYFGSLIQLSDILQVIHEVSGVDNVRWSSDLPNNEDLARVYECDINGKPLLNAEVAVLNAGGTGQTPKQQVILTGAPIDTLGGNASYFRLAAADFTSLSSPFNIGSSTLVADIQAYVGSIATVTEDTRQTDDVRSFTITWNSAGSTPTPWVAISNLKGGETMIFNDFVLRDSQLPSLPTNAYSPVGEDGNTYWYGPNNQAFPIDTVPGFIIRIKAQNTFIRS